MAGGLPRTNSAIRLEVKSWVTTTFDWLALNLATRLLKYGTTSGLVSSNTILVAPPDEDEHPATSPGTAIPAAPSPSAFIIDRRLSTGPSPRTPEAPEAFRAAVQWLRLARRSLPCCMRDLLRSLGRPVGWPASIRRPGTKAPDQRASCQAAPTFWKRFHESRLAINACQYFS